MSGKYWDVPWNPVRGCSPVSDACKGCWAAAQASRFAVPAWAGLAEGGKWTGEIRFDTETLAKPLRWRKPRVVATCWMGDLFHPNVPDEQVAAVFGVMAACPQHRFLVLTKRAERMRQWCATFYIPGSDGASRCTEAGIKMGALPPEYLDGPTQRWETIERGVYRDALPTQIHLGVSVEDLPTADERIPHLLACPAAVRFVSYEPALAGVDFTNIGATTSEGMWRLDALRGALHREGRKEPTMGPRLDWIVVGGESAQGGKGARPCDVAWIRDVVRQCQAAEVFCYVKQLGANPDGDVPDEHGDPLHRTRPIRLYDRAGADMAEWPEDLRIRQFPAEVPRV